MADCLPDGVFFDLLPCKQDVKTKLSILLFSVRVMTQRYIIA